MEIKYNVQAPPKKPFRGGTKSEEVREIESFLTSGNAKNMCFEYEDQEQAKRKMSTIASYKRREKLEKVIDTYRVNNCIYIVRVKRK